MAAMKRERQYDMFDVATGDCQLDDYLNQRYSESDLSSTFWIEKSDQIDELRPPKDGTEQIVIPVQGPNVKIAETGVTPLPPTEPTASPADASSQSPLPSRPSWENASTAPESKAPTSPTEPTESSTSTPAPTEGASSVQIDSSAPASPPSMEQLLAQFRQATQQYEERSKDQES